MCIRDRDTEKVRSRYDCHRGKEGEMARGRRLPRVLREEEQKALCSQFDTRYPSGCRNLLLVRLMLECGLRSGELVALQPEHLDLATCRLLVREGKGAKERAMRHRRADFQPGDRPL